MIHMNLVAVLPDVRYRQRVQKRLTRLRKRLLAFVIKANPECFDHGGRLAPGCFPSRGRKFAWADAESGMQTRHDPLPCGMCYWKILTDQNSGFKKRRQNQSAQDSIPEC